MRIKFILRLLLCHQMAPHSIRNFFRLTPRPPSSCPYPSPSCCPNQHYPALWCFHHHRPTSHSFRRMSQQVVITSIFRSAPFLHLYLLVCNNCREETASSQQQRSRSHCRIAINWPILPPLLRFTVCICRDCSCPNRSSPLANHSQRQQVHQQSTSPSIPSLLHKPSALC